MTKQIIIKLNYKKFKPLLDDLITMCPAHSKSELVGLCVYLTWQHCNNEIKELDCLTMFEYLCKIKDITKEKALIDFLQEYNHKIRK